jgi:hypothetical protein
MLVELDKSVLVDEEVVDMTLALDQNSKGSMEVVCHIGLVLRLD